MSFQTLKRKMDILLDVVRYNRRPLYRGLLAVITVMLLMGLLMFQDGPFVRPHPAIWRVVLAAGVTYLCLLVFLLFQVRFMD
jgi:hypothetical protein